MLKPSEILVQNLKDSISAKEDFIRDQVQLDQFEKVVAAVLKSYRSGGRLYIAGNGGSAADAQHLAAEFVSKLARDRGPLPAEALTVDSSVLTAIGNDYGFEKVFSRQIQGKLTKRDIFLGITTSGNSRNIIEALKVCKEMRIPSILFSGRGGGLAAQFADYCVVSKGTKTSAIQETHIVFAHTLCEVVEGIRLTDD